MNENTYKRLSVILPLLSSPREDEIVNAARAANKILKDAKLSWVDVGVKLTAKNGAAEPLPWEGPETFPDGRAAPKQPSWADQQPPPPPTSRPAGRQVSQWKLDSTDVQAAYDARAGIRDPWKGEFIVSVYDWVVTRGGKLSEKQRAVLDEMLDQLGL